jgi:uncharacterized protein (DUF934 family)
MSTSITLFQAGHFNAPEPEGERLVLANTADPREHDLSGVTVVELQFPKFADGRAFSQARLLRQRLGFAGDIRATGDVLIDQLQMLQRCGFTQAVLRADQSLEAGQRQLARYGAGFYQGDAVLAAPRFAQAAEASA